MKIYISILALFCILGCSKYETRYEGPYEEGKTIANLPAKDILFVEDGVMKWTDFSLKDVLVINIADKVLKARANIKNNKIAYINAADKSIVITDSIGGNAKKVPNSTNTKCIFWHTNDQTLYFVNSSNQLQAFGVAANIFTGPMTNFIPQEIVTNVIEMDMESDGSLAAFCEVKSGVSFAKMFVLDRPNGTFEDEKFMAGNNLPIRFMKWSKFNVTYGQTENLVAKTYELSLNNSLFIATPVTGTWKIYKRDGSLFALVANNKMTIEKNSINVNESKITDMDW